MTIFRVAALLLLGLVSAQSLAPQVNSPTPADLAKTQNERDSGADAKWNAFAAPLVFKLDRGQTLQVPTIILQAELKNDVTSKATRAGQEIIATVRQVFTKSDGLALDKSSTLMGRVVQVSAHSKQRPNGEIMLMFDKAKLKDGSIMPVVALIREIADSDAADTHSYGMNGGRIDSPGDAIGDRISSVDGTVGTITSGSSLPGVMLITDVGGSGVLLARKSDVHLYRGTRLTLVVARTPTNGS